MKMRHTTGTLSAVLIALAALMFPLSAEAQFLKKLAKGLEKVNKGLEQMEKTVKGRPMTGNTEARNRDSSASTSQPTSVRQTEPNVPAGTAATDGTAVDFSQWEKRTPTPHLTWQTKYLQKKVEYDNLSDVSEGIFCLPEYNHSLGYSLYFGFWTVNGKRLFPAIYEQFGEKPRFNSGACVVKSSDKNRCPVILYANGRTRELSKEWNSVTQFYDGVAMVREIANDIHIFYINTEGRKIWPHLAEINPGSAVVAMRPVCDGLRAFYSNAKKKWGFLDADGKIVIQPSFNEVRDFFGGYALVSLGDSYYERIAAFIDKTGKTVVTVPGKFPTLQRISDIADGCFSISEDSGAPTTFYNLEGGSLKTYSGGASGFCDGTAFVRMEQYNDQSPVFVIDRSFDIIGQCTAKPRVNYCPDKPTFVTSPWFTCHEKIAINHLGQPVMYVPGVSAYMNGRLGQFSKDGYAKARSRFLDETTGRILTYTGYVDAEGRYTVVFCDDEGGDGPFGHRLPGPSHLTDKGIDTGDPEPRVLPPVDTTCTGGKTRKALYEVTVRTVPAEGGTVYGSGEYAYGDTVRIGGASAKGYRLSAISVSNPAARTPTFNKFVVKGRMDISCHFVKKDSIIPPAPPGCFAGRLALPFLDVPAEVYLQLGDTIGSAYEGDSEGFLAVLFDANKKIVVNLDDKGKATCSVNVFYMPMNVVGLSEENGRKWLHVDGGVAEYANLTISDNSSVGVINNPLIDLTLMFDGLKSGKSKSGRYRIDITGSDSDKGVVKLGIMQRFSPEHGWLSAGDKIFERKTSGFFNKRIEKGLDADMFDGVTLEACQCRRDIPFYPPEGFYEKDGDSKLKALVKALGEIYRDSGSDYDMRQFSDDLDKILMWH